MAKENTKKDIFLAKNMPSKNIKGKDKASKKRLRSNKATLLRLFDYVLMNKFLLWCIIGVIIILTSLAIAKPALLGYITDTLLLQDGSDFIDFNLLFILVAILFLLIIFMSLFDYLENRLVANISQQVMRQLRVNLFSAIGKLPISYIDRHSHGDMMSRMTNDVENIFYCISKTMVNAFADILTLVGILGVMLWYSPLLTLISLSGVPITIYITRLISVNIRKQFRQRQNALGALEGKVEESIIAYRTVVAFNYQKHIMKDFVTKNETYRHHGIKANLLSSMMDPVTHFFSNFSYLLVVAFGAYFAVEGLITIGVIQAFLLYIRQFLEPVKGLVSFYARIQIAIASAERIFDILDQKPELDEGKISFDKKNVKGDIVIQNIDFSYVPDEKIFSNFSMNIKQGQKIALVGKTGSGKSSLINLIARFYNVNAGKILLDGVDLQEYSLRDLRQTMGIVLQDTVLFSDSIAQNIRYGKLDATDEEIKNAAIIANAHDFIMQLPQGYETQLLEFGSNLSAGQCQLLSITRAILANRPILILDEATASVDTYTEMHLQKAMHNLMENKTCIIIAHRLSTIKNADCIMVLEKGALIEMGTHVELLQKQGTYYQLYRQNFEQREDI